MIKDRRKRTRVPVVFDVSILSQGKKIKVKTSNISLTGISCTGHPQFRAKEPCEIIMALNEDTCLHISGKILRVDEKETTIVFLFMSEDTFFHLKRLLQYNAVDADVIEKELQNPAFIRQ
ncbi:MAG TPA: PilZ domain-containing protein [Smithellaceae bacterium]|nr:PilZ domain-containing protein [Smithellaceae bacterium]